MWSSLFELIIGLQIIVFLYVRVRNYIDSVWQDYGLEEEPARLTGAEKDEGEPNPIAQHLCDWSRGN